MTHTIRDARLDAAQQRTNQRHFPPRPAVVAMDVLAARHRRRTAPIAIIVNGRVITSEFVAGAILGAYLLATVLVAAAVIGLHALVASLPPVGALGLAAVLVLAAILLAREPRR